MNFIQEMTAAYNDMLDIKTSLGFCRHNYAFHISPFIDFCAGNYPNATEITKDMIDQWLVSKTFNTDNTRRIAIINIRHFTRYLNATGNVPISRPQNTMSKHGDINRTFSMIMNCPGSLMKLTH